MTSRRHLGCRALIFSVSLFALGLNGARADSTVVKSFSNGAGIGSVGITVSEDAADKEEDGPQALDSSDDGKLFMLDQINGRIVSFDPSNPSDPVRSLQLPPDLHPTDLVTRGGGIFVWDGSAHQLEAIGPREDTERGLTETRSGEPVDDFTRTAFAQMGSEVMDDAPTRGLPPSKPANPGRQFVATRGKGPVIVDVALADHGSGAEIAVRPKDAPQSATKLRLRVRNKLGSVAFLEIDKTGRMFVLAENIPTDVANRASAFVARYSAAGALEGIYELPLSQTVAVSRRFVTISPDGDVYFLRAQEKSADIVGVGFRPMPNAKVIDPGGTRPDYAALAVTNSKGINMAVGPLSRQRIVQTAYGFEGVQWRLTAGNYGSEHDQICTGFQGRIRRPMYLIGKLGQDVRSVPYCWGCQGSLAQFLSRIHRGDLAGNVCTRNNVRMDVAGVDCSSFVSATWGLSTHFTTAAIPSIAKRLANPWDLQPGDALDKPGSHVVLFLGFTPDRKAEVMEASPGACRGRVCRNVYPLASLLARGFIPVRYRALMDAQ